jgi:quinohemoprotein ethanol dehydrogenase
VRGYFSAYDVNTGKLSWRFYTVPAIPQRDLKTAMEMAAKTWGVIGGSWVAVPRFRIPSPMIRTRIWYLGTGNGGPWPVWLRESRSRQSLHRLGSRSGCRQRRVQMALQFVPGDSWDFDSVQQLTTADIRINGQNRK